MPGPLTEITALVKVDRPQTSPWGSTVAAPAFSELAERLVILLDIPPDELRLEREILAARAQGE